MGSDKLPSRVVLSSLVASDSSQADELMRTHAATLQCDVRHDAMAFVSVDNDVFAFRL